MRDYAATATIDTKANVCSVQLSPQDANLLAFGSANYRVYLYDLRKVIAGYACGVKNNMLLIVEFVPFFGTR